VSATPCSYDAAAIGSLRDEPLDLRTKGVPGDLAGLPTRALLGRRRSELPTPLLTLDEPALAHNIALMAGWCADRGVLLAPHGKTTMAPQLFARQVDAGSWAITLATMGQVMTARSFGFSRLLLANEPADPVGLRWLARELDADPSFELWCFVDSVELVALLDRELASVPGRVRALVEVGLPGGRAGCRTVDAAVQVAAAVRSSALVLGGLAGWDGAYGTGLDEASLQHVDELLVRVRETLDACAAAGVLEGLDEVVVSAGGSAYVDLVAEALTGPYDGGTAVTVVLRSGAYVTHDHLHYQHLSPFGDRSAGPVLHPALHGWGRVISRPDPDLAILDLGKRDVPYDLGLPLPLAVHRGDTAVPFGGRARAVNDQHLLVDVGPDDDVRFGDVLQLGLSHPCTAFDKWQLIPVVDDAGYVVDVVRTFF
jgi:D-serine deaminase-like pyridoxal phosphate-dependent protein